MEYSKNFGFLVISDFMNDNIICLSSSSFVVDHDFMLNFKMTSVKLLNWKIKGDIFSML